MNHLEKHHGHTFVVPDDELIENEDIVEEILEPKTGFWHGIKTLFVSDKKIGELNGKWAAMLKMVLVIAILTVPTFFAWATWVTNEIFAAKYHRNQTEDFSTRIVELETNLKILTRVENEINKISDKVETLPPPEWRRRIEILENHDTTIDNKLNTLENTNNEGHAKILILLEGIKTKVEGIK